MHGCLLCVPVEMWMIFEMHEQSDATPPMYPSPKMVQMHEQEMKSLNLVVGNGIRKHWPFVGSLRPWSESHDSRIFTVPLVTGLVKSQHTSLKPSRPKAGPQQHRQMQRCFFFPSSFSLCSLQPWITRKSTRAWGDVRVCLCEFVTVRVYVCVCAHESRKKRESETYEGRHRLSAGPMNFRPIYLMNEPLEGIHPQTVPCELYNK